jgi:hypothetical protein
MILAGSGDGIKCRRQLVLGLQAQDLILGRLPEAILRNRRRLRCENIDPALTGEGDRSGNVSAADAAKFLQKRL